MEPFAADSPGGVKISLNWKKVARWGMYVGAAVLINVSGVYYMHSRPDFSYKGIIDGQRVKYTEHSGKNVLYVNRGSEAYRFVDSEGATPLDWQVNTLSEKGYLTKLEEVHLERKRRLWFSKNTVFSAATIDGRTLQGVQERDVLERGSAYFERARDEIRTQLRKGYSDRNGSLDAFLKRHVRPEDLEKRREIEESSDVLEKFYRGTWKMKDSPKSALPKTNSLFPLPPRDR